MQRAAAARTLPANQVSNFQTRPGGSEVPPQGFVRPLAQAEGRRDLQSSTKALSSGPLDATARTGASLNRTSSTGPGSNADASMQPRLSSMEASLKEVDVLLKNQLDSQQPDDVSLEDRCAQIREEITRMQQSREKIEARAETVEELLQRERAEHEAQLATFEKDLSLSLKNLNKGLEESVSSSMHLMKVKVVETEKVLKQFVKQLNTTYTPALTEAEANGSDKAQDPGPEVLKTAMNRLLEEHNHLVMQQNDLLSRRQPLSFASMRVPAPAAPAAGTAPVPAFLWTAPSIASPAVAFRTPAAAPAKVPGTASPKSPRSTPPPIAEASKLGGLQREDCGLPVTTHDTQVSGVRSPGAPAHILVAGGTSPKASAKSSPRSSPMRWEASPKTSPHHSPSNLQAPANSPSPGHSSSPTCLEGSRSHPTLAAAFGSPKNLEGSPSKTNLAAIFVDMQSGQEVPQVPQSKPLIAI